MTTISKKNAPAANKKGKDTTTAGSSSSGNNKRKRGAGSQDDAPRAFKRLMALADGKKTRSGLDDGAEKRSKKPKAAKKETAPAAAEEAPIEIPKIRPGERMSEFAVRVNAALPLTGLVSKTVKNGKDPLGLKVQRTRKEKKMHKLYDQWREEERKIKERKEEEAELAEEQEMEDDAAGVTWKLDLEEGASGKGGKKKKKGKRRRLLGETAGKEDDPWAELTKKRGEQKIKLNDVAQAPPELPKMAAKKMLVRGAAVEAHNIPKSAGSLRRREELHGIREDVVASYRKLMEERRAQKGRR